MTTSPVLILGMHRSGTSCLTGLLEEAGLWLGSVKRRSVHNAKGNRENPEINKLNDAVLSAAGATWDNPPETDIAWRPEHVAERARILAGYPGDRIWGFKDPRMLFTLSGWREALPGARLVGSLRHPLAVARSLAARSGMDVSEGTALWTRYNRRLEALTRTEDIPLICFDVAPADYRDAVARLAETLGLSAPETGFSFFEPGLRRQNGAEDDRTPAEAAALYARLRERAL